MKEAKNNSWRRNLGLSAAAHVVVILLCLAVIGNAAVYERDIVTIVLDGQATYTPGPRCRETPRNPKNDSPGSQPALQRIAKTTPHIVHRKVIPDQVSSVETPANPQSEVVAALETPSVQKVQESDLAALAQTVDVFEPESKEQNTGNGVDSKADQDGAKGASMGSSEQANAVYMREHFFYIRDLITKNLKYPHVAKKFGWKGSLTLSFVICEGGRVENIRVVRSSGYKILDDNAVNTIKSIQPFPRPPAKAEIVIPIEYRFG